LHDGPRDLFKASLEFDVKVREADPWSSQVCYHFGT